MPCHARIEQTPARRHSQERLIRKLALFVLLLLPAFSWSAELPPRRPSYNTLALDFPTDGGVMLMGSHMWRVARHLDAGLVFGGGQINHDFDLKSPTGATFNAESKSIVFPFVGPQLSLNFGWIGLSVGYAGFYSKTDLTVKTDAFGTLTGTTKAWGSGVYSPLLVLDFYDSKHDLVFGFGLGGFFGTSFPNLEAQNSQAKISTDESPIDTLTFHVRLLWASDRAKRLEEKRKKEEDF